MRIGDRCVSFRVHLAMRPRYLVCCLDRTHPWFKKRDRYRRCSTDFSVIIGIVSTQMHQASTILFFSSSNPVQSPKSASSHVRVELKK